MPYGCEGGGLCDGSGAPSNAAFHRAGLQLVKDAVCRPRAQKRLQRHACLTGVVCACCAGRAGAERDGPGLGKRFMLTKTLEWNLQWCILDAMLDEHFRIKPAFKHDAARLQRRFRCAAHSLLWGAGACACWHPLPWHACAARLVTCAAAAAPEPPSCACMASPGTRRGSEVTVQVHVDGGTWGRDLLW